MDPWLNQGGDCIHIPSMACPRKDKSLAHQLLHEIEAQGDDVVGLHRSRQHYQVWGERIQRSPTFTAIVARLLQSFGVSLVDCWANVYNGGEQSKPWHRDNYWDRDPKPTVTLGVSLGASRPLSFEHTSGKVCHVMQNNGDVFAFDEAFNQNFRHAIPGDPYSDELRMSIIVWAKDDEDAAVPYMERRIPGKGIEAVNWKTWDLAGGLFSRSPAFAEG